MSRHINGAPSTMAAKTRPVAPRVAFALRCLDRANHPQGSLLARYAALRAVYDRETWRQVITILAERSP
ncbi:MAG: hypothetical protein R3F54_23370 [Alphaproteobacteria bacterium]